MLWKIGVCITLKLINITLGLGQACGGKGLFQAYSLHYIAVLLCLLMKNKIQLKNIICNICLITHTNLVAKQINYFLVASQISDTE